MLFTLPLFVAAVSALPQLAVPSIGNLPPLPSIGGIIQGPGASSQAIALPSQIAGVGTIGGNLIPGVAGAGKFLSPSLVPVIPSLTSRSILVSTIGFNQPNSPYLINANTVVNVLGPFGCANNYAIGYVHQDNITVANLANFCTCIRESTPYR
jgi:hypothetical protein